jgi:hypothetical protein
VWPDNCIDFKTKEKLPVNEWAHLAMTYDGSSQAKGVKFYINGKVPETELIKDNLKKSVMHGIGGINWSYFPFMLGREKERSIENIVMDELKIYNRQLSTSEVKKLHAPEESLDLDQNQKLATYLLSGKNSAYNNSLKTLTDVRAEENKVSTDVVEVMVMNECDNRRETFLLNRGAYDAPGEKVVPQLPEVLQSNTKEPIADRLGLAKWMVSPENPLTSRVVVNRFWLALFGKGIVATPDDFGSQGALPTHPALLDWLAVDFMEKGWNTKYLLKKILMSSTYSQSSESTAEHFEKDPDNEWYSRFPAHRMSAELIRDNALAASGLLVDKIGGPSVYPYQPKGIWEALATRNATSYKQGTGEDLYRRSMYTIWKRSSPPPSMMNFDAPDRYYCVVERQKTATPLQSLVLMNDPQYVEAAKALAEKTMSEKEKSLKDRITYICESLIGRRPDEVEVDILTQLYHDQNTLLKKDKNKADDLLQNGEYQVSENINKIDLATHMLVATTIMNYDEFVMKR